MGGCGKKKKKVLYYCRVGLVHVVWCFECLQSLVLSFVINWALNDRVVPSNVRRFQLKQAPRNIWRNF